MPARPGQPAAARAACNHAGPAYVASRASWATSGGYGSTPLLPGPLEPVTLLGGSSARPERGGSDGGCWTAERRDRRWLFRRRRLWVAAQATRGSIGFRKFATSCHPRAATAPGSPAPALRCACAAVPHHATRAARADGVRRAGRPLSAAFIQNSGGTSPGGPLASHCADRGSEICRVSLRDAPCGSVHP